MKHFLNTQDCTRAELDALLMQAALFKALRDPAKLGRFVQQGGDGDFLYV